MSVVRSILIFRIVGLQNLVGPSEVSLDVNDVFLRDFFLDFGSVASGGSEFNPNIHL